LKTKEIELGGKYILASKKKSRVGCSGEYFDIYKNTPVYVLKKYNNFDRRNNIKIQIVDIERSRLVNFWCSAYDLKQF
jgi:hypothetical protein